MRTGLRALIFHVRSRVWRLPGVARAPLLPAMEDENAGGEIIVHALLNAYKCSFGYAYMFIYVYISSLSGALALLDVYTCVYTQARAY